MIQSQVWEHWGAMVVAAQPVVGSADEARDCAAQAMLQFLERVPQEVDNLEALLVTIAKRRAIDYVRSRARARIRDERVARELSVSAPDVAEDIAARAEARWVDEQAQRRLPPHVYALLRLLADGVPLKEAARRLDMTERAARSQLARARHTVRLALARTLVGVGLCWAGLRRGWGPVAVAAPAVAVALVLSIGTSDSADPVPARPLVQLPSTAVVDSGASTRSAEATHVPVDRPREAGSARTSTTPAASPPATAVDVQTRYMGVEVQRREDPARSRGPVERLKRCLANLRIEANYLGCEARSAEQQPGERTGDGPALPPAGS